MTDTQIHKYRCAWWLAGFVCVVAIIGLAEPRAAVAADVIISEFMAINDTTLADVDGDYADWIEIRNVSGGPVDLAGWYLTDRADELDRWAFPSVTLTAGEHLVVFASKKDRAAAGVELHTDFGLGSDDTMLALVRPDGVTVEHQYDLAGLTQFPDLSYGLLEGDPQVYLMSSPTPGVLNVRVNAEQVAYSSPSGTFTDPFMLTLSVVSPSAAIHYTTDGTIPTAASPVYTVPLSISVTTQIRTVAIESGLNNGPVTSRAYVALAADVRDFDSNLPLVVLDTYGAGINEVDYTFASSIFIETAADGRAAIVDDADHAGRSGLRVRGSSSSSFAKKQYKLEIWDEADLDADAALLGMPAESDWVLYAPYSDKTLMRNYLVYKWYREMGYYSVRTRFCEVFLNTGSGSVSAADYVGVYVLTEKIKAGADRVDIARLTSEDSAVPDVTGGYILEGVSSSRTEGVLGVDWFQHSNMYLNYVEPRAAEMNAAQRTYIADYLNTARTSMSNGDPVNGFAKYIDAESFADYDIVQQITKNNDSWYASVFMHKDRDGRLRMGPVWDFNITLGNIDYGSGGDPVGWIGSHAEWPWYSRLIARADYVQLWIDRWAAFRRDVFDLTKMYDDIADAQALLAEAQARDQARWSTLGVYVWPNAPGYDTRTTWASEIDYMKQWLADRVDWIDSQYLAAPAFNTTSALVPEGFELAITAPVGTVYYTSDGVDPRAAGGSVSASATACGAGGSTSIVVDGPTPVIARAYNFGAWSAPIETTFALLEPSTLRIVEVDYHPHSPTAAEIASGYTDADDFEFIELINIGDEPASTLGLAFGDGVEFVFAEGAIDPGQRIVLVRDAYAFYKRYSIYPPAGTYTGSLDNGGEHVALLDGAGRVVQEFTYGDASPWPARADGKGSSLVIVDPAGVSDDPANWRASIEYGGSPSWPSWAADGDVVINEVLTHTDLPQTDSIELHNTTDAAVAVGGWYLSDSDANYRKFRIPDGTLIPAGGYVVFDEYDFNATGLTVTTADDDPNDFGLSAAVGDDLHLVAALAGDVLLRFVDTVEFGAAFNGVGFGRYPDGTGELTSLQTLTLGEPNDDDPVIGPVVISEIMYHSVPPVGVDEDDLEYIELLNVTDEDVPLDWYDSDGNGAPGLGEQAPWRLEGGVVFDFPAGTIVPAGGTLIVVDFDPADTLKLGDFAAVYGLEDLIAGESIVGGWSGQLSNGGERIDLLAPDSPPAGETFNPYIVMDRVDYSDSEPWPAMADGTGLSIHREGDDFGNDPANWTAAAPTPGSGGGLPADFNDDGVVDLDDFVILKRNFGVSGVTPAEGDADGDGDVDLGDFVIFKNSFGMSQ